MLEHLAHSQDIIYQDSVYKHQLIRNFEKICDHQGNRKSANLAVDKFSVQLQPAAAHCSKIIIQKAGSFRKRRKTLFLHCLFLALTILLIEFSDLTSTLVQQEAKTSQQTKTPLPPPPTATTTTKNEAQSRPTTGLEPPPHSKCLLSPFASYLSQTQQLEHSIKSENVTANYLNSIRLRPFKVTLASTPFLFGQYSSSVIGSSKSVLFEVQASNNSARLLGDNQINTISNSNAHQESLNGNKSSSPSALVAFEEICSGWRNSLAPEYQLSQPAYWALDTRRGALVAKFDFHKRQDFHDQPGHIARLRSPILNPIPSYHYRPDSSYFNSCTIAFRSYMTLNAHLELVLVPIMAVSMTGTQHQQHQTPSRQSNAIGSSLIEQAGKKASPASSISFKEQEPITMLLLTQSDQRDAEQAGEQAAWRDQKIALPFAGLVPGRYPFRLEFTAMPAIIRQASLQQTRYFNGVAIANITLAPKCFGMGIDEGELARLRQAGELDSLRPKNFETTDTTNWEAVLNNGAEQASLFAFLERHKTSILIGVLFVLVAILLAGQWFLCAYLQRNKSLSPVTYQDNGFQAQNSFINSSSSNNNNNGHSNKKPKSILQRIWWRVNSLCCYCWFCCYKSNSFGRDRVYIDGGQVNTRFNSRSNGKLPNPNQTRYLFTNDFEQNRIENNYLRPISALIFEGVELNVNPNYVPKERDGTLVEDKRFLANCNGQLQQHNSIQLNSSNILVPYHIDRKRLTLTKPLGKGAFGEVYQGYLMCRFSNDGKTLLNNQSQDDDSLESHSLKVAVKTLTDERMSEIDFAREAINMSLVSHRNIVELLGVCFDEKPLYIVMELMPGGNLKNFLLKNRDKGCYQEHNDDNNYSHGQQDDRVKLLMGDLLVFALDIARACDFLQKRQFVHRDLAARNCLLTASCRATTPKEQSNNNNNYIQTQTIFPGSHNNQSIASSSAPLIPNEQQAAVSPHVRGLAANASMRSFVASPPSALEVNANHKVDLEQVYLNGYADSAIVAKLADFGMTRDVYCRDYYRMGHKEVPVRWVAPECLGDGVVTTKSDVWSFGIFLWELFSMGQLPYQQLIDNHQVAEFLKSRRHNDDGQQNNRPLLSDKLDGAAEMPPLDTPHEHTPHPIYSIMCACWATEPEDRPQFEEIANRLYWCLQMPDVLATSLPCFYAQHTPNSSQQQ